MPERWSARAWPSVLKGRACGHFRPRSACVAQVMGGANGLAICRPATYHGLVRQPRTQMREPTYFVLASLLDGPLHGYAIIQRTEQLSGGRVRLATGTLYTALDRLTAEGLVELVSEEIVNGRARRSYGLTPPGAGALRAEAERMAEAARLVTRRGRNVKTDGRSNE